MIKPPTKLLEKVFNTYKDDTSKLLVHAATASWTLATIANTIGAATSKTIDPKQKKFIVPQEIADGALNIGLFVLITETLRRGAGKFADSGKIIFEGIKKGSEAFNNRKGGLQVLASLVGAVVSSNILTPIIRGKIAAKTQKFTLDMEAKEAKEALDAQAKHRETFAPSLPLYKPTMAKPITNGGGMKI